MAAPLIDLKPLRNALSMLRESISFWADLPAPSPLKPHLRSAVIQSFEFSYELSVRSLRRVLFDAATLLERLEKSLATRG